MIPWAWAHDHDWMWDEMLHFVWHNKDLKQFFPPNELRFGSWDNNTGAILEQVWAIREGLTDPPAPSTIRREEP